jgi:hypothetical protein
VFGGTICPSCYGWVTPTCVLCLGSPDPTVGVEMLARARHAVDRATSVGTALAAPDILGLIGGDT